MLVVCAPQLVGVSEVAVTLVAQAGARAINGSANRASAHSCI